MELAKKLREIRILRNMTQHQVAEESGIGYKTINNYENGASKPDLDKLSRLCSIYNISADYFINPRYDDEKVYNYHLTLKEQQHIEKYRKLDKQSKKVTDIIIEVELKRNGESSIEVNKDEISLKEKDKEIKFYLNSNEE